MKPGSQEWFRWFYEGDAAEPGELEDRWHEDAVINQDPEIPGSSGQYNGYEGLRALYEELDESYADMIWDPVEVHDLGNERYLVLLLTSGRGQTSGIEIGEVEVAHVVTLRDDKATSMDAYLGWNAGRAAAGLD